MLTALSVRTLRQPLGCGFLTQIEQPNPKSAPLPMFIPRSIKRKLEGNDKLYRHRAQRESTRINSSSQRPYRSVPENKEDGAIRHCLPPTTPCALDKTNQSALVAGKYGEYINGRRQNGIWSLDASVSEHRLARARSHSATSTRRSPWWFTLMSPTMYARLTNYKSRVS